MAVCLVARHLARVAGLLALAPRTSEALWLDSSRQVSAVGGEGVRGSSPSKVSPAFPVCYLHVGKCAGTTLADSLHHIGSISDNNWTIMHIHTWRGTPWPVADRKSCLDRTVVLWVRDPMERLMASWRFEVEEYSGELIKKLAERRPEIFAGVPLSQLFDLNYVAGAIHKYGYGLDLDDQNFLYSFHHAAQGLSWYAGENAVELDGVPNERIFVGRTEHMVEDWERLLAKLQVPLRSDTRLVPSVHSTIKTEEPLSSDAAKLLRRIAQPEYKVIEKLVSRGLLSADYLDSIVHRTDFTMRRPRPP